MIKAVIFDLDGLMVDTEQMCYQLFKKVGKEHNIDVTVEFYRLLIGSNSYILDEVSKIYPFTHEICKLVEPVREDWFYEYFKNPGDCNKPGLQELYNYLKANGYKIAIASSSRHKYIHKVLNHLGFEFVPDAIVGGDEVKIAKPDPAVFLKASEMLNTPVEECLVLEDSRNGIIAAHRANIKSIFIEDMVLPDDLMKSYFDIQLDSLHDVINYLEKQRAN